MLSSQIQGAELCTPTCSPGHGHRQTSPKDKVKWGSPASWRANSWQVLRCRAGCSQGYKRSEAKLITSLPIGHPSLQRNAME